MSVPLSAGDPPPAAPSSDELTYTVFTSPFPLRANVAGASGASLTTTLSILVSNNTAGPLSPNLVNVYVPIGQPGDNTRLPTFPDAVWAPVASSMENTTTDIAQPPTSNWIFAPLGSNEVGWIQFQASGPTLATGDSFELQIRNLVVTTQAGQVDFCIQSQYVDRLFPQIQSIYVAAPVFYLSNLTARDANGDVACQVGWGETVTLTWDCSETSPTNMGLVQSSSSASSADRSTWQEWQGLAITQPGTASSNALYSDTVFALCAGDGFMRCASIKVNVQRPNLWGGTLSVSGLFQANAVACDTLALQQQSLGTATAASGMAVDTNVATSLAPASGTLTSVTAGSVVAAKMASPSLASSLLTMVPEYEVHGDKSYRANTDGFAVFWNWNAYSNPITASQSAEMKISIVSPDQSLSLSTQVGVLGHMQIIQSFPVSCGSILNNSAFVVSTDVFKTASIVFLPHAGFYPFGSNDLEGVGGALTLLRWKYGP